MLDADKARLTRTGNVTVRSGGGTRILVEGFDGEGCTCRDVSALAMVWAIGVLQRELMETLKAPGGGSCGLG